MKTFKDGLYECFEDHLISGEWDGDSEALFVAQVVSDYISRLTEDDGFIPLDYQDSLRDDLASEVLDMLRVKTYGFFNLTEFRSKGLKDRTRRRSS